MAQDDAAYKVNCSKYKTAFKTNFVEKISHISLYFQVKQCVEKLTESG